MFNIFSCHFYLKINLFDCYKDVCKNIFRSSHEDTSNTDNTVNRVRGFYI
jgi:hypothetical protein